MIIKVTQEDIDIGTSKLKNEKLQPAKSCPVSLAFKREFPDEAEDIFVTRSSMTYKPYAPMFKFTFILPDECQKFIADFDDGKEVKPFDFVFNGNYERMIR